MLVAPAASHAKFGKAYERSHHRFAETIRPSLRNGFNGFLRALPGDRALLPPSSRRMNPANLSASVGAPGPHDLAVRESAARLAPLPRPSHPAPNVRDDREPPLLRERDKQNVATDLGSRSTAAHWHDGQIGLRCARLSSRQTLVIPGRRASVEPGIHFTTELVVEWIPGSR